MFVDVGRVVAVIFFSTEFIVVTRSIFTARLLRLLRNILIFINVFNSQRRAKSKHALDVDGFNLHYALDHNPIAFVEINQVLLDVAFSIV